MSEPICFTKGQGNKLEIGHLPMLASRSGFSMRGIIPDNAKVSTVTIA
ncbi:MAG: hypothetical protein P8O99_05805 [Pseudomonadales bacterium]|nr:hypothetical protein [Pseudomonadales bacterium]